MTTTVKTCFKCGAERPLTDFYKHPEMSDGRLNKCKECAKSDVALNREKKPEFYKEYEKSRANAPHRVFARKRYAKTQNGINSRNRARKAWLKRNPKKRAAHVALGNAVRDGRLLKLPCEVCGSINKIHGHHDDYSKPFEVVWLCPLHHRERHKEQIK